MDDKHTCLVLTGPVGAGKTTALKALVERLANEDLRIAAVLQPDGGRRENGQAVAFSMECIRAGGGSVRTEVMGLAREAGAEEKPGPGMTIHGRFAFDDSAFAKAETFLASAEEEGLDAICMDEIGKLELIHRKGLRPALDGALSLSARPEGPPLLILTTRRINVPALLALAGAAGLAVLSVDAADFEIALAAARTSLHLGG